METYIEAVHCTDDNFQGIEGRFGGSSEVQVVSTDENGKVQRLRLGGTDSEDAAIAVASVLQASLFSEGVQSLENGGSRLEKLKLNYTTGVPILLQKLWNYVMMKYAH